MVSYLQFFRDKTPTLSLFYPLFYVRVVSVRVGSWVQDYCGYIFVVGNNGDMMIVTFNHDRTGPFYGLSHKNIVQFDPYSLHDRKKDRLSLKSLKLLF